MSVEGYLEKIEIGTKLLDTLSNLFSLISGISKLKNKIKQEVSFLKKSLSCGVLKKEHILCSNLHHYESLVDYLKHCKDCSAVLEVFQFSSEFSEKKRLCVDVVSSNKLRWTKVIARNPKALSLISDGEGEFGQRSVLDQAEEYLACAEENPAFYSAPQVEFYFGSGIDERLGNRLTELGVLVSGYIITSSGLRVHNPLLSLPATSACEKLNLDVSSMLAYVSALTNGHAQRRLKGKVLTQQAQWERLRPVKPILDEAFQGKELYCCEHALESFRKILGTVGGPGERSRGAELVVRLRVVEDSLWPGLQVGGQVKERSLAVFGTGLALRAVTVTANQGFVRAAANQGIEIPVLVHESRALTERKELPDSLSDSLPALTPPCNNQTL